MSNYVVIIVLLCFMHSIQGEVINGFYREKLILERDIYHLNLVIRDNADSKQTKSLLKRLKQLGKQYSIVLKKYSQTEELINTFALVDPELFSQVSNVRNANGILTNIVVQYVSRVSKEFTYFTRKFYVAEAYTSVGQSKHDENVCTSRYGTNTITITIGYGTNEIKALGHEFAHVMYMVPNLKEYMEFSKRHQEFINGHSESDPGYFKLQAYEDRFMENYMQYMELKKGKDSFKPPVTRLTKNL